jgi:hypothetical protein
MSVEQVPGSALYYYLIAFDAMATSVPTRPAN